MDVKEFDFTELVFTELHFKELEFKELAFKKLTELFCSPPSRASACVHEWLSFARHSGRHDTTHSLNYWSSSAGSEGYVPHHSHGVSHRQSTEIILVLQRFQRRLVVFRHPWRERIAYRRALSIGRLVQTPCSRLPIYSCYRLWKKLALSRIAGRARWQCRQYQGTFFVREIATAFCARCDSGIFRRRFLKGNMRDILHGVLTPSPINNDAHPHHCSIDNAFVFFCDNNGNMY